MGAVRAPSSVRIEILQIASIRRRQRIQALADPRVRRCINRLTFVASVARPLDGWEAAKKDTNERAATPGQNPRR